MTIVDSLKAKGSTGGNNIAEAINNLPMGGSGRNEFVVNMHFDDVEQKLRLDKTFAEILDAIKNGLNPIIFSDDLTDDPETDLSRTKFAWSKAYYSATDEITNCYIVFVGHEFEVYDGEADGGVYFHILYGDDSLKSGYVDFSDINIIP